MAYLLGGFKAYVGLVCYALFPDASRGISKIEKPLTYYGISFWTLVVSLGAITGQIIPAREWAGRVVFWRWEMANLIRMRRPRWYHATRDGVPKASQAGAPIDIP